MEEKGDLRRPIIGTSVFSFFLLTSFTEEMSPVNYTGDQTQFPPLSVCFLSFLYMFLSFLYMCSVSVYSVALKPPQLLRQLLFLNSPFSGLDVKQTKKKLYNNGSDTF